MRNYALLVLVVGLGAYAYFGIHKKEVRESKEKALNERLIPWKSGELKSFAWEFKDTQAKLERDDRGWVFTAPFKDRADLASVNNWLDSIAQTQREMEVYPAGSSFDLGTYGLEEPAATLLFEPQEGEARELKVGQLKAFDELSYVLDQTTGALFTAGSGLENLLHKQLLELRDRRVWRVKDPVATSLELVNKWRLSKDSMQTWSFDKDVAGEPPLGSAEVSEYLTDLTNLRILEVVSETSTAPDLKRYGLHRPFAELHVVAEDGGEPEVFKFSSLATKEDPNSIYVTSSSYPFIARLYASVQDHVDVPRSKFFDRSAPFQQIAGEDVERVQFKGVEGLDEVTGQKAQALAGELKRTKLREYLPTRPRGLAHSLSLQNSEDELLFKISWDDLGEDDRQNIPVFIEPGQRAGKIPAGTIKDLISLVKPKATETEVTEPGEVPSIQ